MTLIVFVVDTSFSMAVKNYRGCSTLDTARSYISEFIKMRGRENVNKMYDRFYVITSEDFPRCIKEIKQLNREGALNEQLKNLRAKGNHTFIDTLYNAFQFITLIRNASGIDNYGYGRFPYFIDPVVLITLSDGKAADEIPINVKLDSRVKNELTKEAYRWDQKLYCVVFRMGAECAPWIPGNKVEQDIPNVERIANLIGGNSFRINVHKEISPSIEAIREGIASPGVYVKFVCPFIQNARTNGETETAETKLKKSLEVRPLTKINVKIVGGKPVILHWPIPESFWYKRIEAMIPARNTHPVILFSHEPVAVQMITDFPFDKYELDPSPLVDYIIEKFKSTTDDKQCLPVFIHNSGKTEGYGKPFGFIKPMSSAAGVNLVLMPYNYPVLLQLLHDLKEDGNIKNNPEWKKRLENYLDSVPPYYLTNLKKHLQKLRIGGIPLLDDQAKQSSYSMNIVSFLTGIYTDAKTEREKIMSIVANNQPYWYGTQYSNIEIREMFQTTKHWKSVVANISGEKPVTKKEKRKDPRNVNTTTAEEQELFKDPADLLETRDTTQKTKFHVTFAQTKIKQYIPSIDSTYKNPLILKKAELVNQIPKMMANLNLLLRESNFSLLEGGRPGIQLKLHHAEELHQLPVQQMGNYEEYIKAQNETGMAPLRELEPKNMRSHAFGNPFKTDKKSMAVDEVGEGPVENNNPTQQKEKRNNQRGKPPRRKAGPLGLNSLCAWRERRRSLSECSSMVSDLSYTSDLEIDELSEPNIGNYANGYNGDLEISSAVQSWGLEDETEEPQIEPTPKKRKLEISAKKGTPVLDEIALRAKKREVAEIVRKPGNDTSTVEQLKKVINGLSVSDKLELTRLAARDSLRFKRTSLAKDLEKEASRLQKLVNQQNNGIKPRQ